MSHRALSAEQFPATKTVGGVPTPDWSALPDGVHDVPTHLLHSGYDDPDYSLPRKPPRETRLGKDIAERGIRSPLKFSRHDETGSVGMRDGNHRLRVARDLGLETVPVKLATFSSRRRS